MIQETVTEPKIISKSIPEEFICPITQSIMTTPVILFPSGQTYDKDAIEDWLTKNNTDPNTRKSITGKTTNWALKSQIDAFLKENPEHNPIVVPEPQNHGEVAVAARVVEPQKVEENNFCIPLQYAMYSGATISLGISGPIIALHYISTAVTIGAIAGSALGGACLGGGSYVAVSAMIKHGLFSCNNAPARNRDAAYEVVNESSSLRSNGPNIQ